MPTSIGNNTSSKEDEPSVCPYANLMSTEQHKHEVREALNLAKTSCPAFHSSDETITITCPFRRATSTEEFQKLLQSVPPSHYSAQTTSDKTHQPDVSVSFRLALEHVHAVSQAIHDTEPSAAAFTLRGGCPFKHIYRHNTTNEEESAVPFVHVMESFSLSAIMSQMLRNQQQVKEEIPNDSNSPVDSLPTSINNMPANNPNVEQPAEQRDDHDNSRTASATHKLLSMALKQGTSESHRAAENVHFVRNFIKGIIPRELFVQLLHNLCHVYSALEEELDRHASKSLWVALHRPQQLARTQALHQDLFWFTGRRMPEEPATPATADYVARIRFLAQSNPLLLLAHAYTRYLGDLSGGRILARVARRALDLPEDGSGLKFYEFENIHEGAKEFKHWYRKTLDGLSLTEEEVRTVVAEANVAFALNMRMFEELDVLAGYEGAEVRPLSEALKFVDNSEKTNETGVAVKCPFASMQQGKVSSGEKTRGAVETLKVKHPNAARCPWPFILLHDPIQGLKDYKTFFVLCLVSFYVYKLWSGSAIG